MYKRPQPILDDVELILDDENEDTEANEIQPEARRAGDGV